MGSSQKSKRLKQWQLDLIGVGVSAIALFLLVFDYENQIFRSNFGSTNDKTMNFIMRLLDKQGGKPYVYGFIIFFILFFAIGAILSYKKEKNKKKHSVNGN